MSEESRRMVNFRFLSKHDKFLDKLVKDKRAKDRTQALQGILDYGIEHADKLKFPEIVDKPKRAKPKPKKPEASVMVKGTASKAKPAAKKKSPAKPAKKAPAKKPAKAKAAPVAEAQA